jgi:hypothetical protein
MQDHLGSSTLWKLKRHLAFVPDYLKDAYENQLMQLAANEIERLLRGDFTESEFQNLCHNFSEDDEARFKKGCLEYQKKLFGSGNRCSE